MALSIVPYYAAVLAIVFIALSISVIRVRGRHKVMLGDGGLPGLARLMRVHGNFAEYVPLTLLLLAMAELHGLPALVLHGLSLCLVAGRLMHAWGLSQADEIALFRAAGMILTFAALGGAAVGILLS